MSKFDYLIVGAGLFGSVFAYEATQRGKKCLVIDKRNHIAGNIRRRYKTEESGDRKPKSGFNKFDCTDKYVQ